MPDNVTQRSHGSNASNNVLGNRKCRESEKSFQSSWISHWMPSGNNLELPVHKSLAVCDEGCAENGGVKQRHEPVQISEARKLSRLGEDVDSDSNVDNRKICRYREGMVHVTPSTLQSAEGVPIKTTETKLTFKGSRILKWNSKNLNSTMEPEEKLLGTSSKPFPMPNITSFVDPKTDPTAPAPLSTRVPKKSGIQIAELPDQWMKRFKSLEKKAVPSSGPFQDHMEGSSSSSLMYGMLDRSKYEKSIVRSAACIKEKKEKSGSSEVHEEHFKSASFTRPEHEHYSSLEHHDHLLASKFSFPIIIGQEGNKAHNSSDAGLVELKQHHDLLQRMPACCVHGVETFRLSTVVDSVEGFPWGPSKFSKTTQHLFFTKKNDLNLSNGNQAIIDSTFSKEFEGNAFHGLVDMPPVLCSCCKQQSDSQSLRKSSRTGLLCQEFHNICRKSRDSAGEGLSLPQFFYSQYSQCAGNETYNNASDSKCHSKKFPLPFISRRQVESKQKEDGVYYAGQTGENESTFKYRESESSAESSHMNIDPCQSKNFIKDLAPSSVQKDAPVSQAPMKSQSTAISPSKARGRDTETHIPDKNEELPTFDRELSTSKTESLDAEHLLLYVDRPECSNSNFQQNCSQAIDSSSRWVKRLRSNSLETRGTKSLNMGDISSREKGNKLFRRMLNCNRDGLQPTFSSSLGKGCQQLDKAMVLSRHQREASSLDLQKGHRDATLSHSWIKRWCRGSQTGPAQVLCGPDGSKVALEEFHRKQFPSIAAMALMGKAVSNFQPCEFRKSGSLVVWNTGGF